MDYNTLKNSVYAKYYQNSYLPGALGGSANTSIFNYLMFIEQTNNNLLDSMNISKVWCGDDVTWYTDSLKYLLFVPKFSDDSDREYLDRLLLLTDSSQDVPTITDAVYSVVYDSVVSASAIEIIDRLTGIQGIWDDESSLRGEPPTDPPTHEWSSDDVLQEAYWTSEIDVPRTTFVVKITFAHRGLDIDGITYDYWIESINYTKIEDMVKLYKPPGSTFELVLVIPEDIESVLTTTSNTLIA